MRLARFDVSAYATRVYVQSSLVSPKTVSKSTANITAATA